MAKIIVRDSLPDDPIFKEGLQIFFPRLVRKRQSPPDATRPNETPDPTKPIEKVMK